LVEGTTIESLQHAIKDKDAYPEIEWDATVRVGEALTEAETQFLAERRERVARAVSAFLNEEVDPRDVPVIGIASSGGGCRAMIASLATFETFDRVGLLRGTTYIAGVSGSTWAMSSLYSVGRDWDALRDRLQKQLSDNYLSVRDLVNAINSPDGPQVLMGMAQKYFGDRSFSTVDLYGTLLSARVRAAGNIHHGPQRNFGKLSDQRWAMTYEDLPLPIYTAVSHEVGKKEAKYQWWEFTPFEVGFQKMLPSQQRLFSAWVPTWSFGRQFEKGESVERLPEISLGLLLGTFGSAFTASVAAIWNEFQDVLPKTLQQRILPLLEDISQVHPISPATFPNPLYHLRRPESPDDTDDDLAILNAPTLALMDAGFENNIPFAPLLRQERQVDLVIAVDASMDVGVDPWLRKAEKYAKERGVVFPPLPLPETGDAKGKEVTDDAEARCRIFSTIKDAAHINTRSPETHRQAPSDQSHAPPPLSHDFTLIYLPLLRNPTYSATLDPQRTEWCATHNFTFTPSQTAQLAGLANANVEESLERIRDAVRRAWRAKRARRERRERERWGRKMEDGPAEEF
ncbi:acyl transferase/acyl hydrolase/lysophospholipase, partial [Fimicolochytrium jonesii]|uniref:acyl transferase/acyl hydrolase/lysophospholipase n=1 Tax=Fimicolochytrium jonesii TaxID=1396493 RepID=UPI0022FEF0E9